ncbi:nucleotidyltransferase domain-containing protein [Amycolatopsis sp. lyj-90]|uniref:nucleotidyltransferase domain-containing protein n=1 Tax=Amycolatopsis sp. lyj-90 TaxID=2789285 RepID=UPI00397C063E
MFTTAERDRVRDELVAAAKAEPRITAAGFAGSSAHGKEDRWSDIDLALRLAPDVDYDEFVALWTESLYRNHHAITHLDVQAGNTLFRVFLLPGTLQVDIAFWHDEDFGPTGPRFEVLFGEANDVEKTRPPVARDLIDWAWLYALHARSSIARRRVRQAEHMISGMRDEVFNLACLRHDVPATQGRGIDDLPAETADPIMDALVRSLDPAELSRAFTAACEALLTEAQQVDPDYAERLAPSLRELAAGANP